MQSLSLPFLFSHASNDDWRLSFQSPFHPLPVQTFIHQDCNIDCFEIQKHRWVKIFQTPYQNLKEFRENYMSASFKHTPLLVAQIVNFFVKGSAFEVIFNSDHLDDPYFQEGLLVFYARDYLSWDLYKVRLLFAEQNPCADYKMVTN